MTEESFKRKLTAILSADVEGYSRLMGEDEDATIRTLTAYRDLMSTLIQKHRGRVVDSPGDNLLAEFLSVVDAVRCAVEIQEELRVRNAELPENRRMEFRIGVNLGDVVEEGERIYGDGVNITARVEGLAEGGGICISGTVYDSIKNKLSLGYESLGEHTVKNIKEPVRVYRMLIGPEALASVVREEKPRPRRWQKAALAAVVLLVVLAGAWAIWNFFFRPPVTEPASVEKMAFPLPDKPSLAVLAFDNLSGDPSQEYFSDGIAEQIITVLSQVGELFVISRNSSFSYKGKPVKIQQVSEELGVRYVLEGSVRKSGDRVRITAQLVDAIKGQHLWAESYDRDLKNIFEIQDEITMKIVTGLRIKLTEGERARITGKKYTNPDLFIKLLQANSLWRKGTKESYIRFGQLAQEVVDMAPDSPAGYRMLSWYHKWLGDGGISRRENYKKAFEFAQKTLSLDEFDGFSHATMGYIYLMMRNHEKAIASGKRAVEFRPNGALVHLLLGSTLCYAERFDEGIAYIKQGLRLNPFPAYYDYYHLGRCYYHNGQYEDALIELKKALQRAPDTGIVHFALALTYISLDREKEARASAAKALELMPHISVAFVSKIWRYKTQAGLKLMIDAMRKAGFPD
jgi:adenylate cyclase